MKVRVYTEKENDFFRQFVPGHSEREVVDAFEERFGRRLSLSQVRNRKARLGLKSGTKGGRFKPGQPSPNKGKHWGDFMSPEGQERCRATQFRKGDVSGIAKDVNRPLLDIRIHTNGHMCIKVDPRNKKNSMRAWIPLSHFVWMQHNGRDWPEDHRALFIDGDNRNFDPENIMAVPNGIYGIITGGSHRIGMPWHDRESLETAMLHAQVIRERRRLELKNHVCGVCGKTFDARGVQQKTCDECLKAGKRAPGRGRRTDLSDTRERKQVTGNGND